MAHDSNRGGRRLKCRSLQWRKGAIASRENEQTKGQTAIRMRTATRELQVHTVCQMILVAIAAGAALYFLRSVLLPFILALFFVTGLSPVLHWIERRLHAPRMVAVVIAFLLGILLFAMLWLLIWMSVASLVNNAPTYRQRLVSLVEVVEGWIPGWQRSMPPPSVPDGAAQVSPGREAREGSVSADPSAVPAGRDGEGAERAGGSDALPEAAATIGDRASRGEPGAGPADENALPEVPSTEIPSTVGRANGPPAGYDFSTFLTQHVGDIMTHLSSALMDLLSSAMMVLIFMFFLLLGDTAPTVRRHGVWNEIQSGIRSYIVTKTLISIVTGAVFGLVLWFFGIPLALVFGLLAFLLNFIPNIGPIIASVLPLPLILLHPDLSVVAMIVVIALTMAVQFISGNVIEPKIMGDSFQLHPIVILLTLMFWGMLWGIVGMFLATPITSALKVFLEEFEHTRPIARWLEGRFERAPPSPADAGQAPAIGAASSE